MRITNDWIIFSELIQTWNNVYPIVGGIIYILIYFGIVFSSIVNIGYIAVPGIQEIATKIKFIDKRIDSEVKEKIENGDVEYTTTVLKGYIKKLVIITVIMLGLGLIVPFLIAKSQDVIVYISDKFSK